MRVVRANPSVAARVTFVALAAAAIFSTFLCLESTARGERGGAIARLFQ